MADFVTVAKKGDLAVGACKKVLVQGKKIALFNVDGEIYATDDTCSHAEASLSEGELIGDEIVCPKHGARFNVKTGEALSLPAWAPVATYEVKVDGDEVKVSV